MQPRRSAPGQQTETCAGAAPAAGAIDLGILDGLLSVLPPGNSAGFLDDYIAGIEGYAAEIGHHVDRGELDLAQGVAHTLVSVAGNIGALRLSQDAAAIEQAAKAGKRATCERLAAALGVAATLACAELRQAISRRRPA